MPVEGIAEEDDEGEIVIVLRETKQSMTEQERLKLMRSFERNMCPDYLDDGYPPQKFPKEKT